MERYSAGNDKTALDRKTYEIARDEARRFLQRCAELEESNPELLKTSSAWNSRQPNRATGAVRRASMDLTRALADLRRPKG